MSRWSRRIACSLCCVWLAALLPREGAAPSPVSVPTKVVFSLDFIPLGVMRTWYAALAEGYYRDEGLDVSIIPAQGNAQ